MDHSDFDTNPSVGSFKEVLANSGRVGLWEEKARIEARREQLTLQTRDLAFQHYPTFISAADCCREIAKEYQENQEKLSDIIDCVPKLLNACSRFKENVQKVSMHRKRTSLVLAKHPRLLEVLELPQLMDTCVKSNHHEEALAIQQLCGKIQKPLGDIPLIRGILDNVHSSSLWMLNQLLGRLKCQIQLPECLRIIGFIRRMGVFNETQLRLKFLQAREAYFSNTLQVQLQQQAGNLDDYSYLSRVVEITRICVFDTITQYRALFSDDEAVFSSSSLSRSLDISYRQIFPSWLFWKLENFMDTLKSKISVTMEEQQIDSLVGQSMFFGQSLGRVGYDFRVALVPIFIDVVLAKIKSSLRESLSYIKSNVIQEQMSFEKHDETNISFLPERAEDLKTLKLNFYALAEICNGVISACNKLRYTAPVAAHPVLVSELQDFLEKSSTILSEMKKKLEEKTTKHPLIQHFDEILMQFEQRVVPFCNHCLSTTFDDESELNSALKFSGKRDVELHLTKEAVVFDSDQLPDTSPSTKDFPSEEPKSNINQDDSFLADT